MRSLIKEDKVKKPNGIAAPLAGVLKLYSDATLEFHTDVSKTNLNRIF
jgi:hypothetical protein